MLWDEIDEKLQFTVRYGYIQKINSAGATKKAQKIKIKYVDQNIGEMITGVG